MPDTFISNTSLAQRTDEDGTMWHKHHCCSCGDEWWDRSNYGKWCSDMCFYAEDGYPDEW